MRITIRLFSAIALISLLGLSACTSSSVDSGESSLDVNQQTLSATTNASGTASFTFTPAAGSTSFQLSAFAGEGVLQLISLNDPSGQSILSLTSEITRASGSTESSPYTVVFPYLNGAVASGSYSATYRLRSSDDDADALAGRSLQLIVTTKADADPSSGTLKVNLVLVGPAAGDVETRDSLEAALEAWQLMYDRAGIAIDPAWYEFAGPNKLPDPRVGDSLYETITSSTRADAVNVVFGSELTGLGQNDTRFGISGSMPGSIAPSARSVVALSILAMTGSDGRFDLPDDKDDSTDVHNNEVRLAAEEMGRLTARYLGLENIVDFKGSKVTDQDSIADTASCLTLTACTYDENVRANLMFPFPVRKIGDYPHTEQEYYARDQLTAMQSSVLNASVLVD